MKWSARLEEMKWKMCTAEDFRLHTPSNNNVLVNTGRLSSAAKCHQKKKKKKENPVSPQLITQRAHCLLFGH